MDANHLPALLKDWKEEALVETDETLMLLDEMARITKGRSYRASSRAELAGIYNEIDRLEKTEVKLRRYTRHTTLFQWPSLAALAALALEFVLDAAWMRRIP